MSTPPYHYADSSTLQACTGLSQDWLGYLLLSSRSLSGASQLTHSLPIVPDSALSSSKSARAYQKLGRNFCRALYDMIGCTGFMCASALQGWAPIAAEFYHCTYPPDWTSIHLVTVDVRKRGPEALPAAASVWLVRNRSHPLTVDRPHPASACSATRCCRVAANWIFHAR